MRKDVEPRHVPDYCFGMIDGMARRLRPDDPALDEWYEGYTREHRRRLAVDLEIILDHVDTGAVVLECGAVPPLMTGALMASGFLSCAVDVAPERFATSIEKQGLRILKCDLETETLPMPAETFDAVVFHELFEHLRIHPIATMREVLRVLRPGGVLLLSTPNLRSFRGLRNLLFRHRGHTASAGVYQQYEKLETLGHMGHVREYTVREVADFLERVGFRVDKVIYRGGHGRGLAGIAERLLPAWRPFFSLVAGKPGPGHEGPGERVERRDASGEGGGALSRCGRRSG
jgi:SAM-dependent methyltransferase